MPNSQNGVPVGSIAFDPSVASSGGVSYYDAASGKMSPLLVESLRQRWAWNNAFVRETVDRQQVSGTIAPNATTIYRMCIALFAGDVVTKLSAASGGTPLAVGTNLDAHYWFALYTTSGTLLRQTADQGNAAWTSLTRKELALSSPYTVPASGLYHAALMINPGTGTGQANPTIAMNQMTSNPTILDAIQGVSAGSLALAASNTFAGTGTAPATLTTPATCETQLWMAAT